MAKRRGDLLSSDDEILLPKLSRTDKRLIAEQVPEQPGRLRARPPQRLHIQTTQDIFGSVASSDVPPSAQRSSPLDRWSQNSYQPSSSIDLFNTTPRQRPILTPVTDVRREIPSSSNQATPSSLSLPTESSQTLFRTSPRTPAAHHSNLTDNNDFL